MKEKILIVEDQFIEADYLRLMLTQAHYMVTGIARSVAQAEEMIIKERPDFVLLDIFLKGKLTGIDLAKKLAADNIPFVYLSANSNEEVLNEAKATQPYGFLVKPFREKDLLVTLEIARYRHEHSVDVMAHRQSALQKHLKKIMEDSGNRDQKLLKIAIALQPHIPFDFLAAGFDNLGNADNNGISFLRIGFNQYQIIGLKELVMITGKSQAQIIALQSENPNELNATFYDDVAFKSLCKQPSLRKLFADTFQLKSHLEMPMHLLNGTPFSFCLYSRRSDAYNATQVELFERIHQTLIDSIEVMVEKEKKNTGRIPGNEPLQVLPKSDDNKVWQGIVGKSHLLLNVFDHITQVAPADTSVLILGESGTGKEKMADCIHHLSPRKGKPFVKINCAALPAALIESELFGHEKGAFTGAVEKRIGKFEKADKGTIFLDEVGEMPLELQVKLLRVLQEKEIERVGSTGITKVDVRIIAATNRNLEKEVAEGRFRLDLYYRLNVFPVTMPALRERKEDIPALALHFVNKYNLKTGKRITGLTNGVLTQMRSYDWPGNIRELEHLIERAVLLARGTTIENIALPAAVQIEKNLPTVLNSMKTMHENEKEYIIAVLKKCNGRIWGAGGAAEILNLHPSTLKSRMNKLGIKKQY